MAADVKAPGAGSSPSGNDGPIRARKKLRVILLCHEDLVPPDTVEGLSPSEIQPFKTEFDVLSALRALGHETRVVGVQHDLATLREALVEFEPDIVFNLLEEFHSRAIYDQNVVAYLELMRVPYTGCNPRGLVLARDKALSKKILHYHRIPTPRFAVFEPGRKVKRPKGLEFPLIVKSLSEEGSAGMAQASLVDNDSKLAERVMFVHEQRDTAAIVEQYIEGRELYVGLWGNRRIETLPVWELDFGRLKEEAVPIATYKAKWDLAYQERHGVKLQAAQGLSAVAERRMNDFAKRIYRRLELSGYARIDMRLGPDDRPYFLEANPNPDIGRAEEFASAALAAGYAYETAIQRLLNLGLRRFEHDS